MAECVYVFVCNVASEYLCGQFIVKVEWRKAQMKMKLKQTEKYELEGRSRHPCRE